MGLTKKAGSQPIRQKKRRARRETRVQKSLPELNAPTHDMTRIRSEETLANAVVWIGITQNDVVVVNKNSHLGDEFLDQILYLVMDHNHLTIKTFMAITAERDAAIRERNMALEERKRAFAERDMAMLQRDAAIAERNAAMQEREEALSSVRYRESSMNDNSTIPNSLGNELATYSPRRNLRDDSDFTITEASESVKPRRGRQPKDGSKQTKSAKSPRVGKRMAEGLISSSKQVISNDWNNERDMESDEEDVDKQVSWKDNLGLNQINFDESAMPVPVCSCTGSPQPCYRWGNGGWQSACCTTTISMYPLPQVANKRYSRVGGRKMSGSAFSKLLNRLAGEGYDFSTPLDLKDHWAKHGTNRYSTLK
ncbi:hypothetical protein BUALT_Bualt04G0046500 [Buddleja alternifolia]|uniref:GAGA-binding transcriptional activator n=1 Tax=Buddleja alternifolia TaxID=168488 RepID=A0AAV6XUG4_9LAMI|nr:hypothetical protein BUALT_Bualt04G0046500 [Buddleja alternifolia]